MKDGILLIDKEAGVTSRFVDNKVQRLLGTKKVGHLGTLDPFATGLLVVAVGKGTKYLPYLGDEEKEYEARLRLFERTSTGDPDGEVLERREDPFPEEGRIHEAASKMLGEREQLPPMASAVKIDGKPLTGKVTPLGYVTLTNPIRHDAPETFAYFAEQGVDIKVISGDNPVTVSEVAARAGIAGAERYVDAGTLKTDEDVARAMREYTVFGRVTPAQKRQFVNVLKEQGNTVAMTGDGVNDILALKDADCSIAMASGSEAAAQAAQVVLLESDFSCMPSVVLEGRRVVNNIQRSASLFLVKNIFSLLLSVFSAVFMITYPLEPSQISLISMFTIGVPAFFLAMEPNKNRIEGHFLPNVFLKALPGGLTDVLAVGALVIFGRTFAVGETDIATAATILLAIVGFMVLYKISQPVNRLRVGVLACCAVALVLASIYMGDLFAITAMSTECIMLCVLFSIASEPVFRYLSFVVEQIGKFGKRLFSWHEKNKGKTA